MGPERRIPMASAAAGLARQSRAAPVRPAYRAA
jgi:hypothetical protein